MGQTQLFPEPEPEPPPSTTAAETIPGPERRRRDYKSSVYWGRAKLGPNRVYWVVFSPYDEPETIHGEGYEADVASAEQAASAVLDRVEEQHPDRYKVYREGRAGNASHRHKMKVAEERRRRGPKSGGTQVREYLYTWHYDNSEMNHHGPADDHWRAHPILKKTPKKVWVHRDYWRGCRIEDIGTEREDFRQMEDWDSAIVLDRVKLERDGNAYGRGGRQQYYIKPEGDMGGGQAHSVTLGDRTREALTLLGLYWPCDGDSLKAAYRRRSKEVHPDVGGSPEEFRRVHAAYEHVERIV